MAEPGVGDVGHHDGEVPPAGRRLVVAVAGRRMPARPLAEFLGGAGLERRLAHDHQVAALAVQPHPVPGRDAVLGAAARAGRHREDDGAGRGEVRGHVQLIEEQLRRDALVERARRVLQQRDALADHDVELAVLRVDHQRPVRDGRGPARAGHRRLAVGPALQRGHADAGGVAHGEKIELARVDLAGALQRDGVHHHAPDGRPGLGVQVERLAHDEELVGRVAVPHAVRAQHVGDQLVGVADAGPDPLAGLVAGVERQHGQAVVGRQGPARVALGGRDEGVEAGQARAGAVVVGLEEHVDRLGHAQSADGPGLGVAQVLQPRFAARDDEHLIGAGPGQVRLAAVEQRDHLGAARGMYGRSHRRRRARRQGDAGLERGRLQEVTPIHRGLLFDTRSRRRPVLAGWRR